MTSTTATATSSRAKIVDDAIREIAHIATLPEITLKIVELVESPKSTAQDLHKVIANDPALCSRILKVVNSSFYGLPGQIGSINRAIVMLGLNAVKNIAIAASLSKLFRGGELTPGFSAKSLWKHSVCVAAASKLLADRAGLAFSDEAFLAGLLHDIGLMVEMQYDRNKLIEVLQQVNVGPGGAPQTEMLEVEDRVFGANHQHFGAALCDRWKFPANFRFATGHHHKPMELGSDCRTMACVVHAADRLVAEHIKGTFRLDLTTTTIAAEVLDALRLGPDKLQSLKEALPEHLKSVDSMLA